jgi:hypothetical protein
MALPDGLTMQTNTTTADTMTDEQINEAIAQACGIVGKSGEIYKTPDGWVVDCPQFATDLNAMHDAEKVLDYEQCESFSNAIADIVHAENREKHYPFPWGFARIHATARQRAEAFLRTLGKWEPTTEESSAVQKEVQG